MLKSEDFTNKCVPTMHYVSHLLFYCFLFLFRMYQNTRRSLRASQKRIGVEPHTLYFERHDDSLIMVELETNDQGTANLMMETEHIFETRVLNSTVDDPCKDIIA